MSVNPNAGKPANPALLVDVPKLIAAYYESQPDSSVPGQRVAFGTSGHRGSALHSTFTQSHVLAITQAIVLYRRAHQIDGPLFLGIDTHALSYPAFASALEVLSANGVETMIAADGGYAPTPVISHSILTYNDGRSTGLADGIVITPSHNPPEDGGFKYNPPHGGPADKSITSWIQAKANDFLAANLEGIGRIPLERALRAANTHRHDYITPYVADLANVLDLDSIRASGIRLGVDPLGGAGVAYWPRIAEHYRLNLTVVNDAVDPTFRFMTVDWDGRIRMDPSSLFAMQSLIGLKDKFDVAFACDTDHDRHGIVTRTSGLLAPNHYLSVCIHHLFRTRREWDELAAVGKTIVSSSMIDRVAAKAGREVYEVPVGFKWFVEGLLTGSLGFAGEESAGASFLRKDGTPWSTDKDGIIAALLAAEITASNNRDPGEIYRQLTNELGDPVYERIEASANAKQKALLAKLSPQDIPASSLAGDPITSIVTTAPGNDAPMDGVKVSTANGWFAARPSGTEDIYKIYAESFAGESHLHRIQEEAQQIVSAVLAAAGV